MGRISFENRPETCNCEKTIPERNSDPKITKICKNVEVLQKDHVFRLKIVLKLANVKKRFLNEIQIPKSVAQDTRPPDSRPPESRSPEREGREREGRERRKREKEERGGRERRKREKEEREGRQSVLRIPKSCLGSFAVRV